jgi:hypothetical protein
MRTDKPTEPTLLRLAPEDRTALRREALRRLEAGEAIRLDVSAIVRELLSSWREGRAP